MNYMRTRPDACDAERADHLSSGKKIRRKETDFKRVFDPVLSRRIDCIVFLAEHETNSTRSAFLRSHWRHLEEGVPNER